MDCTLCYGTIVGVYNLSGNSVKDRLGICTKCYGEEADKMMNLMNIDKKEGTSYYETATNWGFTIKKATKWIEEAKKREQECNKHIGLLAVAFREGSYSDIQVKPGNGPSIPAHRFLLATTSEVLKTMLASNLCKSAPIDSISLPEFNREDLETFLEFLYCGKLAKEKFDMHFQSLTLAADKYVIPHLQTYCEQHILKLLDSSNSLKILDQILSHTKEIYFSPSFEDFARQNLHLMVQIARAHSEKET
ncbi:hypothetical protein MKW98_022120 [Papaver atlanticum]|uniref:BTB domain-containing protein n=1 Tax=Papaver atlanticum TaxID=357466 RepID=A0AAD4TL33_9MAGN|nr:hypothetical protein MKW98_022120 [Papaver atlanticum]